MGCRVRLGQQRLPFRMEPREGPRPVVRVPIKAGAGREALRHGKAERLDVGNINVERRQRGPVASAQAELSHLLDRVGLAAADRDQPYAVRAWARPAALPLRLV